MKKITLSIVLLLSGIAFAQIPSGYYNTATGTGYTLKTNLRKIIDNQNDGIPSEHISTDQGYSGLYTTYLTSDKDFYYENDGSLLDMYTENPTGAECFFTYGTNQDDGTGGTAECQKYNREHIIPQSVFGSATPMYSDAHFVTPSDKYVNAQRGDLPFGVVSTATNTYSNGSKKGNNLNSGYSAGYSSAVFEPIDEFKGDVARMILYFGTRYETQVASWSFPMFNGTSDQVFNNTFLNILLKWHMIDPVSQREIDRNNAIYARQNNRNPYIDHPEYVCQIYPTQCSALAASSFALNEAIKIFPNPTNTNEININTNEIIYNLELYTINGQLIKSVSNPVFTNNTYTLSNLTSGFYLFKVYSDNGIAIKKILVN
ncbi:Probable extracellular ribonuclease precursor [Flavobacterium indicum GPTSA100-9 = DSM 17447]|uniref:Probable extracellular ribonuclease n=1 Tax=Flavobacterium indicum (strain DSM 17447 / CIP 109464 / GPTSA100-9) TaxID=1094466 RepID=H8XQY1_FLAIG|nr:endonuclease [Flavobacterium indicum]CCG53429.1 Probable extracellular ribonuclease precursor [Flavobacterium indicum GPTSA100-9 = DSM 17447]